MTLEDLLDECATLGYTLSYCFQGDGFWRVVLHKSVDGGRLCQQADCETFVLALETCMTKMGEAEFVADEEQTYFVETRSSLEQLLAAMPAPAPLRRRSLR